MRARVVRKKIALVLYHWAARDSTFHTDDVSLGRSEWYVWLVEVNLQPTECLRSFLRLHWAGKPVVSLRNVGYFLRLWGSECAWFFFYTNARLVILSSALEISSQSGVIPARTSQKITTTAYPSRRIAYKFKLSYELLSMFGMYAAVVNPGPFSFFRVVQCLKVMLDKTIRDNDF